MSDVAKSDAAPIAARQPQLRAYIAPRALAFVLLVIAALVPLILWFTDGHFIYALDDPYIHLALARHIAEGHYGINAGEFSSPSSSILWPFLLAPFAHLSFSWYVPLAINVLCAAATAWVVSDVCAAALAATSLARERLFGCVLAGLALLAFNTFGLVFTGMEHSLQLLCACVVARGLINEAQSGQLSASTWSALLIGPLVRYENLALSAAAGVVLLANKRYRAATLLALASVLPVACFSLFLLSLDLPALPTSVMAKSLLTGDGGVVQGMIAQWIDGLCERNRGPLIALVGLAAGIVALVARERRTRLLAAISCMMVVLHMCFGSYGWFSRYEVYLWAFLVLVLGTLAMPQIARPIERGQLSIAMLSGVCVISVGVICLPYIWALAGIPGAAGNIYGQQYQMRRFAQAFDAPLAVNDLGLVSLDNPHYVLDLWGLASKEALFARRMEAPEEKASADAESGDEPPPWMSKLVDAKGVEAIMIYDIWFEQGVPKSWKRVGTLNYEADPVTAADIHVAFYATTEATREKMSRVMHELEPTLPQSASFVFADEQEAQLSAR